MANLSRLKIAVIATDGVEESEITEPVKRLRDAGADVHIVAPHHGEIQAFRHHDKSIRIPVDRKLEEVDVYDYSGLVLPGGALNSDSIRLNENLKSILRAFDEGKKPIAAICHAPWALVSADLVKGRTLTSYPTLQDDIRNAGGRWVDEEVVVDQNLITSRKPSDLNAFNREVLKVFSDTLKKAA